MSKIHIAALIMCKNEKKRLHVTLESLVGYIDSLIIFDTGSTDNTMDICREFCQKNKIPLRLKEGSARYGKSFFHLIGRQSSRPESYQKFCT